MKIALISRAVRFSPNSEARDAAMFCHLVRELALQGISLSTFDEDRLPEDLPEVFCILSMARSTAALQQLKKWQAEGRLVLNNPQSLLQLSRYAINEKALQENCGVKMLRNVRDVSMIAREIAFPLWLKNDNPHTQHAEDVRFVRNTAELIAGMQALSARKVGSFVACAHCEGRLMKFYGVLDTDFFYIAEVKAQEKHFSKFGLEQHNHFVAAGEVDETELRSKLEKMARELGLTVYGGDLIITADGTCHVIDLNDWPSFSPCVAEAAKAIATCVQQKLKARRV